jgi:hypothetical protein
MITKVGIRNGTQRGLRVDGIETKQPPSHPVTFQTRRVLVNSILEDEGSGVFHSGDEVKVTAKQGKEGRKICREL